MLKIDLGRLEREGPLEVDAAVPADDPLWNETELTFDGPLEVRGTVSFAGSGEVVARLTLDGTLLHQCRRCLEPVRTEALDELTLVFTPRDELASEDDADLRVLEPKANEIDLGSAVREELILHTDRFVVCDPECRGLCPRCGVDLNDEECDCTLEEPDPRWDALRALNED